MKQINSMQELADLRLNPFAAELFCESYIKTTEMLKLPPEQTALEIHLKGCVLTIRKAPTLYKAECSACKRDIAETRPLWGFTRNGVPYVFCSEKCFTVGRDG